LEPGPLGFKAQGAGAEPVPESLLWSDPEPGVGRKLIISSDRFLSGRQALMPHLDRLPLQCFRWFNIRVLCKNGFDRGQSACRTDSPKLLHQRLNVGLHFLLTKPWQPPPPRRSQTGGGKWLAWPRSGGGWGRLRVAWGVTPAADYVSPGNKTTKPTEPKIGG
jgi:hypothetical protein